MKNKLAEKRGLASLYRGLGQPIPAELSEQISILEAEEAQQLQREQSIRSRIQADLKEIFAGVEVEPGKPIPIADAPGLSEAVERGIEASVLEIKGDAEPTEPSIPEPVQTTAQIVANLITEQGGVVAPEPVLAMPQKDLEREIKYLREWISRIAATGPGGGAAQIYNLDMPTKTVTGDYTIGRKDYYVGVSSTVKTYITLPTDGINLKNGRVVIVKDESGHAQLTPIKLVGTIDNDVNGAEIRINNGAVQLIYRDGWRII